MSNVKSTTKKAETANDVEPHITKTVKSTTKKAETANDIESHITKTVKSTTKTAETANAAEPPTETPSDKPKLKLRTVNAKEVSTMKPTKPTTITQVPKKKKVDFNKVDVYLFDIKQSIDAIPTTGGIPLGMEEKHRETKEYTCNQFEKLHSLRNPQHSTEEGSNTEEPGPSVGPSNAKERLFEPLSDEARKELFFSNDLPFDQDVIEESLEIVESREIVGCKCRFGNCLGGYCSCMANGIECQVEDDGYPCACRKSKCKNPQGRKEFNRSAIREHFYNTLADLIMNEKREQNNVKQ